MPIWTHVNVSDTHPCHTLVGWVLTERYIFATGCTTLPVREYRTSCVMHFMHLRGVMHCCTHSHNRAQPQFVVPLAVKRTGLKGHLPRKHLKQQFCHFRSISLPYSLFQIFRQAALFDSQAPVLHTQTLSRPIGATLVPHLRHKGRQKGR